MNAEDIRSRLMPYDTGFTTPCLIWPYGVRNGYGKVDIRRGDTRSVHIVIYEDAFGPVPIGKELDHACEVRVCAEPTHLVALTKAEHHAVAHLRRLGHELVRTGSNGGCKECLRLHKYTALRWQLLAAGLLDD